MLLRRAEKKFGITGVEHILRGRFLEGLPSLGILIMREQLDSQAVADFFATQARSWIARSLEE